MRIFTVPSGPIQTNAYLVLDPARGEALLVDAPHDILEHVEPVLEQAKCRLVALLLTHGHWDHIGAAAEVQAKGVPVYAHEADRLLIEHPEVQDLFSLPGVVTPAVRIDHVVGAGDVLELMGQRIEIRHVPGHCPGNVLFYFPALGAACVGDSLFAGGVGRSDLPGGSALELQQSIRTQIYSLPGKTVILAGHGPATTVANEMAGNPFVAA